MYRCRGKLALEHPAGADLALGLQFGKRFRMDESEVPLPMSSRAPKMKSHNSGNFISLLESALISSLILFTTEIASAAGPPSARASRTAVLLDFSSSVPESFWEALETELERSEMTKLLQSPIVLMKREQFQKGMEFTEVLQVRLQGDCAGTGGGADYTASASGPLGWVYVVSGQIQPFAFVNCNRVGQAVRPALRNEARAERRQKMARAIARIIGHELTHIITQDTGHTGIGVQKAYLTPANLVQDALP